MIISFACTILVQAQKSCIRASSKANFKSATVVNDYPSQSSTPSPMRNTYLEKFFHQLLLGEWVKAIYLNKVWCYQVIASKLLIKFQCTTEDNFSTRDILLPNYLLCHLLYNFMSCVWSTFSPDFRWLSLLLDQSLTAAIKEIHWDSIGRLDGQ